MSDDLVWDDEAGEYVDADDIAAEVALLKAERDKRKAKVKPAPAANEADDDEDDSTTFTPGIRFAPDTVEALVPDFKADNGDAFESEASRWSRFWNASAEVQQ